MGQQRLPLAHLPPTEESTHYMPKELQGGYTCAAEKQRVIGNERFHLPLLSAADVKPLKPDLAIRLAAWLSSCHPHEQVRASQAASMLLLQSGIQNGHVLCAQGSCKTPVASPMQAVHIGCTFTMLQLQLAGFKPRKARSLRAHGVL